jgi:hypothetical protein
MNTALNITVIAMLPLDWVRSASAWSWRSSSRSRPNVGGARSPPNPLDAARTTVNRGGGPAPGRLLHPARASGGRSGGATGSGATAKAISLVRRRGRSLTPAAAPVAKPPVAIAILQPCGGSRGAPLRSGSGNTLDCVTSFCRRIVVRSRHYPAIFRYRSTVHCISGHCCLKLPVGANAGQLDKNDGCFASLDRYLASASFGVLTVWSLGLIRSTVHFTTQEYRQVQFTEFSDSQTPSKNSQLPVNRDGTKYCTHLKSSGNRLKGPLFLSVQTRHTGKERSSPRSFHRSSSVQSNLTVSSPRCTSTTRVTLYSKHARTAPRAAPAPVSL